MEFATAMEMRMRNCVRLVLVFNLLAWGGYVFGAETVVAMIPGNGTYFKCFVNPSSNKIYVISAVGQITVIDGVTHAATRIAEPFREDYLYGVYAAINPVTNQLYLTNGNALLVVDGRTNAISSISVPAGASYVAVNKTTNRICALTYEYLTILDGTSGAVLATIPTQGLAALPVGLAINEVTNTIYVSDIRGFITAVDGNTFATSVIPAGSQGINGLCVNSRTNTIYAADGSHNSIIAIDGQSLRRTTIPTGPVPRIIAVNEKANMVYAVDIAIDIQHPVSSAITLVDGATNTTFSNVPIPGGSYPNGLDFNPYANRVYIAADQLHVIDASTGALHTVDIGQVCADVAVNPVNGELYVPTEGGNVCVISSDATLTLSGLNVTYDGTPKAVTALTNPPGLAVNVTYNGVEAPPTAAGTYAVAAKITALGFSANATGTLTINKADPVLNWSTPAPIILGDALSALQLNASANTPGTFVYSPPAGTVLSAGSGQTLSVQFFPADASNYNNVSSAVRLDVLPPIILSGLNTTYDGTPKSVTYTTNPPGLLAAITYNGSPDPPSLAGTYAVYATLVTPGHSGSVFGTLTIARATPAITWNAPAPIVSDVALSALQLNANASVPGSFVYSPASGALLPVGQQTLTVSFSPADPLNYAHVSAAVSIVVLPAIVINALDAQRVYDGSPKSVTATSNPPGLAYTLTYDGSPSPPIHAGSYRIDATLTAAGHFGSASGILVISKATPALTWPDPPGIDYAQQIVLSNAQLNAVSSVPGSFDYTPSAGTKVVAGEILSVRFTPTDTVDFNSATAAVSMHTVTIPVIYSPPHALPNPAFVGQSVAFSAAATEAGNAKLVYTWDFGDGATSVWTAPTHSYTAPGAYTVTLTVTDETLQSTTASLLVTINGGNNGPSGPSQPANSTALIVSKLHATVNFKMSSRDTLQINGSLPAGYSLGAISGQPLIFTIGDVTMTFSLNSRGQGKTAASSVTLLKPRSGSNGFSVKLAKLSLLDGLQADPNSGRGQRTLLVGIELLGTNYATTVNTTYSGNVGGRGQYLSH